MMIEFEQTNELRRLFPTFLPYLEDKLSGLEVVKYYTWSENGREVRQWDLDAPEDEIRYLRVSDALIKGELRYFGKIPGYENDFQFPQGDKKYDIKFVGDEVPLNSNRLYHELGLQGYIFLTHYPQEGRMDNNLTIPFP